MLQSDNFLESKIIIITAFIFHFLLWSKSMTVSCTEDIQILLIKTNDSDSQWNDLSDFIVKDISEGLVSVEVVNNVMCTASNLNQTFLVDKMVNSVLMIPYRFNWSRELSIVAEVVQQHLSYNTVLLTIPLIETWQNGETRSIISYFKKVLKISIADDFYLCFFNEFVMTIWEVYQIKTEAAIISQKIFDSHDSDIKPINMKEILRYKLKSKVQRRYDFRKVVMHGVVKVRVQNPYELRPELKFEDPNLKLGDSFTTDTYIDLKMLLNFSGKIILSNSSSAMELLTKNGADFCAFYRTQTVERAKSFTMLQPMVKTKYMAYFQKPNLNSMRNAFFYPLHTSVWLCMVATWILFYVSLIAIMKVKEQFLSLHEEFNIINDTNIKMQTEYSLRSSLWWIVTFISIKGLRKTPKTYSLRVGFIFGSFLGMFVYLAYSSTILSFISVPISPINTFNDLLRYNFKFTVHRKSKPMQDILMKIIEDFHLQQNVLTVDSTQQITHLLEQPGVSTIAYSDSFNIDIRLQNYSESFICHSIGVLPINDRLLPSSISLRKGSAFKETFNYGIIILMERGFHRRYVRRYESANIHCKSNNISNGRVNLRDVITPFCLLGIGIFIALSIVTLEFFQHR